MIEVSTEFVSQIENNPGEKEFKWFDFSFGGEIFSVTLSYVQPSEIDEKDSHNISLTVKKDGAHGAQIFGTLKFSFDKKTCDFYSLALHNTGIDYENSPLFSKREGHIRGLVAATIKHMLSQGLVDKWISSTALSSGAKNMYKNLKRDENFTAIEERVDRRPWLIRAFHHQNGGFRYVVTSKNN